MLSIDDTLGRARRTLSPGGRRPLTLYCCGPTVYRYAHLGNLRTFLLADLVRRVLAYLGVEVNAVQNITDVGHLTDDQLDHGRDKMLIASGLEGRSVGEIAEFYTDAYLTDAGALNLIPFDAYPRASDHVDEMIGLVAKLESGGHAYETAEAVYFDLETFPAYGSLSGNRLADLEPGHRIEVDADKRFHGDFALWRKAGPARSVAWDSPWGRGFPGWHVECSAMSMAHLGEHIDCHIGGVDLIFPHHECEIAQSEAAVGHQVVAAWLHGAHLLAEGRKMAKSTGNFLDVRTLAEREGDPIAFRLLCLQARYGTQLNFTWEALDAAERSLRRLRARVAVLARAPSTTGGGDSGAWEQRFLAAVCDDLDTPTALALAHEVASDRGELTASQRLAMLRRWDAVLGLNLGADAEPGVAPLPDRAAALLDARERARTARDYAAADRLRDELAALGVAVADTPDGTEWTLV